VRDSVKREYHSHSAVQFGVVENLWTCFHEVHISDLVYSERFHQSVQGNTTNYLLLTNSYLLVIRDHGVEFFFKRSGRSASQIPGLLRNTKVHYRVHKSPPRPRPCFTFRNKLYFFDEELLALRPASKLEDHPL
jgi:hypothetical protein